MTTINDSHIYPVRILKPVNGHFEVDHVLSKKDLKRRHWKAFKELEKTRNKFASIYDKRNQGNGALSGYTESMELLKEKQWMDKMLDGLTITRYTKETRD